MAKLTPVVLFVCVCARLRQFSSHHLEKLCTNIKDVATFLLKVAHGAAVLL